MNKLISGGEFNKTIDCTPFQQHDFDCIILNNDEIVQKSEYVAAIHTNYKEIKFRKQFIKLTTESEITEVFNLKLV